MTIQNNIYNLLETTLEDEQATKKLAEYLAGQNIVGSVWLSGDLGAGKTTLTRYWLRALGHTGAVKSPTYTLVEPYYIQSSELPFSVYHADLYRLQDQEELDFIGFDEYLDEENALIIIEWASRAEDYLPEPVIKINIVVEDNGSRKVMINTTNVSFKLV